MRHSRICLGATAPPSTFLWELPRGQWGHSQPLISGVLQQQLGCAGGEFVVETKLGLDSAWLLRFLCVGAGEKMLPPMPLPSGHRAAHPAAREEQDGKAAPLQTSESSGSAPTCCHSTCASVPAHALLQVHPRHSCRGKKGIECEAQEAKGCKRSPGGRRCQSLRQDTTRDGTG